MVISWSSKLDICHKLSIAQTIVLLGPRDLAGQVSFNNDVGLYEEFNLLNPSQKSSKLLESEITPDLAEELLMREKDPTIFLTSEVVEKLAKNCDEACKQKKNETLLEIDMARVKSNQYFEKEAETINSYIEYLDNGSKGFNEISKGIEKYLEEFEPGQLKQKLNEKINIIKDQKDKVNSYWGKVKKGVGSMSNLQKLQKAAKATSTILGAVGKTRDKHHVLIYNIIEILKKSKSSLYF